MSDSRKRVSLACEACRARRTRCNGEQPRCAPCQERGIECTYKHTENKRKPPSKRYVESLQARIAFLEGRLAELGKASQSLSPVPQGLGENAEGEAESELSEESDQDSKSPGAGAASRNPIGEITQRAGRLNIGEDGQLRYFGAQSGYNLIHGPIYEPADNTLNSSQQAGLAAAARLGKVAKVSRDTENHLLELYWRWQNPWVYLLDKESFMKDYQKGGGPYCTPLLLSAIFALASRYSDRPEVRSDLSDPHTAGNMFAEQAKLLMMYESENATLATVQAACLLSLRWMSENKESLGWLYAGMATRMAYNLGLNLDCAKWVASGHLTNKEAEIRNITWWGCYKLDKLYCLGLGRPGTTRTCDIACAKPSLLPEVEFEPWVPLTQKNQVLLGAHSRAVSSMIASCDHLTLISEPLELLYSSNSQLSKADAENVVASADVACNAFYTNLPSHLRLPSSPRTPCLPHIYQLHIQFHVMQIQLHRPLIRRRSKQSPSDKEEDTHLKACRHSATEVAKLLRIYDYHYTLRLVPVVTVLGTFNAAVVHLMDVASPEESLKRHALRHLRLCVVALSIMGLAWAWSERALRIFRLLASEWLMPHAVPDDLKTDDQDESPIQLRNNGGDSKDVRQHRFWDSLEQEQGPDIPVVGMVPQYGNWTAPASWLLDSQEQQQGELEEQQLPYSGQFPEIPGQESVQDGPANSAPFGATDEIDWLFNVDLALSNSNHFAPEFDGSGLLDSWISAAPQQPFTFEGMTGDPRAPVTDHDWLFPIEDQQ